MIHFKYFLTFFTPLNNSIILRNNFHLAKMASVEKKKQVIADDNFNCGHIFLCLWMLSCNITVDFERCSALRFGDESCHFNINSQISLLYNGILKLAF